jgi:hypothetical protein
MRAVREIHRDAQIGDRIRRCRRNSTGGSVRRRRTEQTSDDANLGMTSGMS